MNFPAADDLFFRETAALPRGVAIAITVLRWVLAAFFALLAVRNLAGDATMTADFARWGFPSWFRVVTAVMQLAGALLLLEVRGAFWGAATLVGVLVGATATHLIHDPPAAAISPVVVLALTSVVGVALRPPFLR